MRKEITISELAKLMNVSVHQIRYFEEKGVLYPAYIDENQYRMYGIDQIYQLAQILMLRKLELSVQAIGSISDAETSPDDIQELLLRSASRIEAEISRLQTLHSFIYKVLGEKKRFAQDNTFFEVIQRDEMALSLCVEMEHETELNARMLFQKRDKLTQLF